MTDLVAVTRSGGITGRSLSAELLLTVGDARSVEVQGLLARIPFDDLPAARPQPDRYTYTFALDGRQFVVAEQDLTVDLEELARLVLGT
ncbi:MAG: hypothetical protein ACXWDI_11490 [Nocardioides sp.]